VRAILSRAAGVIRNGETLREAAAALAALAASGGPASDPAAVALTIVVFALRHRDSVGAHSRLDFPQRPADRRRIRLTLAEALPDAAAPAPEIRSRRA
jgi:L-aspartate oxidase